MEAIDCVAHDLRLERQRSIVSLGELFFLRKFVQCPKSELFVHCCSLFGLGTTIDLF